MLTFTFGEGTQNQGEEKDPGPENGDGIVIGMVRKRRRKIRTFLLCSAASVMSDSATPWTVAL